MQQFGQDQQQQINQAVQYHAQLATLQLDWSVGNAKGWATSLRRRRRKLLLCSSGRYKFE
jgi:hypothetical protein